jgi:hypothetical protein
LQRAKRDGRNQVAIEGIIVTVTDNVVGRGKKAT